MARLFKINAVNSDGTEAESDRLIEFQVIDPATNKPFVGDDGKPCVAITLKPISQSRYRAMQRDRTERILNKKTRAFEDQTDWDGLQDDLVVYAVQGWRGILGADDKPLQCVLDAKLGLPGDLKNELVQRSLQGEGVSADASAASFRPAS